MSNEADREAFEAWMKDQWTQARDIPLGVEAMQIMGACSEVYWQGWQARAAYQRTQAQPADALVGALEQITRMTYDEWTNGAVASRIAEEALAAYRAAQEKPHD